MRKLISWVREEQFVSFFNEINTRSRGQLSLWPSLGPRHRVEPAAAAAVAGPPLRPGGRGDRRRAVVVFISE